MRVLVTGATGFIGSHSAGALQRGGHDVVCLVRDPAKLARVFRERAEPLPEHVVGDMADAEAVGRAMEGADAVLHAAALVSLEAKRADEVLATNARGVANVVGGAVRRGVKRIVYVSSVSALSRGEGPRITADSPVVAGETAYARSKSDAELRVRALQDEGAPIRTTYPAAVVGPDDPGLSESNHAIRAMVRDLMLLTSGGFQPTDVRDVAEIHRRLLELAPGSGRYVVAGPELSWAELTALYDELTGRRLRRVAIPGALLRAAGRLGDLLRRVVHFDFPLTGESMDFATLWPGADGAAAARELGFDYRPQRQVLSDALRWMVRAGHLDAASAGRLA